MIYSNFVPLILRYIANLVQNNPNFVKFYSTLSKQFSPPGASSKINSYVYARLSKSSDLLVYVNRSRSVAASAHNSALERIMRKHFLRMHNALSSLKRAGFVYTDFKPENVLIDVAADRSYLIDLESVVSAHSKFLCLRTLVYSPPLFSPHDGRLIDVDGLSQQSIYSFFNAKLVVDPFDRILSWTFCFSLYVLMCQKPADFANYARLRFTFHDRFRCISFFKFKKSILSLFLYTVKS